MKKAVLLAAILAGAILSQSFAASPPSVQTFVFRDKHVSADFLSVAPSSCPNGMSTLVSVSAGFTVQRENGTTTRTPLVAVTVSVFDDCSNEVLVFATGTFTVFDLQIDPLLKKARLKATGVPLWAETTGLTAYADVDLTWTATDKAQTSNSLDVQHDPGMITVTFTKGTIRPAVAMGSVKLRGCFEASNPPFNCNARIPETTQFTPEPSFNAVIQRDGLRQVTIIKQ